MRNGRDSHNKVVGRLARAMVLAFVAGLVFGVLAQATAQKELVIGRGVDSSDLDPHTNVGGRPNLHVIDNIFETLVLMDESTGEYLPMLATSWANIDDFTWEFTLREGVTFHNGEPFNAEAVKFSFERINDPDFDTADKFPTVAPLDRVEILDDYTIRVVTQIPVPVFLAHLTRNGATVLAPAHYAGLSPEQASVQPIGTGPYRLVSWTRDDALVLEATDDYWGGRANIDRVVFRTIPEIATGVAELRTGGINLLRDVPTDFLPELEADPATQVLATQSLGRKHMGINQNQHEALQDPRVRLAIQMAVDVDTMIEVFRGGLTTRMASMVNPPNHNPALEPIAYDPEGARALLAEAGYPAGFSITVGAGRVDDAQLALTIAQYLSDVGIEVTEVETWEWGQYIQLLGQRTLPALYVLEFGGGENTPETDMWAIHPDRQTNSTNWFNQEWYDLAAELAVTFDPELRQAQNYRLQEIMREDNPWLWLWREVFVHAAASNVVWEPLASDRMFVYQMNIVD